MNKLEKLYNSEINFKIWTYWDAGYIGHIMNMEVMDAHYETHESPRLETLIDLLWESAKKHFPAAECFKV